MNRLEPSAKRLTTEGTREHAARQPQLAMAVEQAGESIVITDVSGQITYVNPAFERTTGYTRQEVLGRNPRILKSGAQTGIFYEQLWQALVRGETWRGRFINKRKDGTLYHEEASISPVVDPAGRIVSYVAVKRDITREQGLEEQFHAAQRMESIGQLAGGIAHDFNNLLAVILGNLELLEERIGTDPVARNRLAVARQAGKTATGLTRQLLAFGRRQVLLKQVLDLNAVVSETLLMLGRLLGANVHVVTRLEKDLARIEADPGQLQQCILNLAVNARDAMQGGGTLRIETENVMLTDEYRGTHGVVQRGDYVLLSVADNGTGMSPDVQTRIFEPFFTTKPKGQGTGLGLATVYGIVKQSGGYVWVYSELGTGTIFKIYLPRTAQPQYRREPTTSCTMVKTSNLNGTVLLVEDDPTVREITRRFLGETGLTVLEAETAEDAIRQSTGWKNEPELLVTDLMLPGKDGVTLAGELLNRFPELKVIIVSGYTEHGLPDPTSLRSARFLSKPFSRHELAMLVASMLDVTAS